MTKRSKTKYPGLQQGYNLKVRWEALDQDYIDKLSDEEKAWLNKFNEEYVGAGFKKNKNGTFSKKRNFHTTPEERKTCTDRNNARNRDLYTRSRTRGWIVGINDAMDVIDAIHVTSPEDALLDLIDLKDRGEDSEVFKKEQGSTKRRNKKN